MNEAISNIFSNAKSMAGIYEAAKKNDLDLGIKVNKTFLVPKELIYIEEGHNIRAIDPEHVEMFRAAYADNRPVPPLFVTIQSQGLRVEEGHHRKMAGDQVPELTHFEVKLVENDPVSITSLMITTSQGKPLSPLERARAYQRLAVQGLNSQQIAEEVKRSRPHVEQHLMLLNADEETVRLVESGEVKMTTAIQVIREHGNNAGKQLKKAVEQAKVTGNGKVTTESLKAWGKLDFEAVMTEVAKIDEAAMTPMLRVLIGRYKEHQAELVAKKSTKEQSA